MREEDKEKHAKWGNFISMMKMIFDDRRQIFDDGLKDFFTILGDALGSSKKTYRTIGICGLILFETHR